MIWLFFCLLSLIKCKMIVSFSTPCLNHWLTLNIPADNMSQCTTCVITWVICHGFITLNHKSYQRGFYAMCQIQYPSEGIADSKVHGANMGPIWGRQDPGGPHVGPMNLAIWDGSHVPQQPLHRYTYTVCTCNRIVQTSIIQYGLKSLI